MKLTFNGKDYDIKNPKISNKMKKTAIDILFEKRGFFLMSTISRDSNYSTLNSLKMFVWLYENDYLIVIDRKENISMPAEEAGEDHKNETFIPDFLNYETHRYDYDFNFKKYGKMKPCF